MAVILTDDFTGTTGATWDTSKWTLVKSPTAPTVDINANRGRVVVPTGGTNGRYLLAYANVTATRSQELYFTLERSTSTVVYTSAFLLASGAQIGGNYPTPTNGYRVQFRGGNNACTIFKIVDGTTTTLTSTVLVPATTDGPMAVRFRYEETTGFLALKVWAANTTEPSTWTYSTTDTAGQTLPVGVPVLNAYNGTTSTAGSTVYFDDAVVEDISPAISVNIPVTALTASALMPDATVETRPAPNTNVTRIATADTSANGGTGTTLNYGRGYNPVFKFDVSGLADVDSAVFRFTAAGVERQFTVTSVDTAWTEADSTITPGASTYGTFTSVVGENSVDLSKLVREWVKGQRVNNGFMLVTPASDSNGNIIYGINSRENSTGKPALDVAYHVAGTNASVAGTPFTASASLVEPVVATTGNAGHAATPWTATALFNDAAVSAVSNPNVTVVAEPLTASASFPGGGYSAPLVVQADAFVASAALIEPVLTTENNAVIQAAPFLASATIVPPAEAAEDVYGPYAARINAQSDTNDIWLRLDETGGTVAANEMPTRGDGQFVGSPVFGGFGLENRRVVGFTGDDYIALTDNEVGTRNGTMEIVFRTSEATGSLIYGNDDALTTPSGTFKTTAFITAVSLSGGKVAVSFTDGTSFIGTGAVNDNKWHHLVVTWAADRLQVFVDGKVYFKRYINSNIVAVPDTIGVGFKGEIMEFVFHDENVLSETDAIRNYYAAFGIVPIQAEPFTATAELAGGVGKGNRKRALGLFYNTDTDTSFDGDDTYNWSGLVTDDAGVRLRLTHYGENTPFDMGEFKVFPKSIQRDERLSSNAYLGGSYYDEVTGEARYLDVSTDIDADDYDLVFFINMPERRTDPVLFEQMIAGVRNLVDRGASLWVPQPELAVALGVVDRVEAHSMARESVVTNDQGNARGLFDARSAQVNPWDGNPANGRYYFDNHALNRYRVAAKVEGLTDLGGFIDEDMYFGRPRDPFKPYFFGWKVRELTNGLQIGDEFMYGTQDEYDERGGANYLGAALDRFSVVAVPPTAVKAGTVVTRENAKHFVGTVEVDNPYKDYATSIVVEPGDSLAGTPVGGRIFVNFMEGQEALGWTTYPMQVVPSNEDIGNALDHEDAAKRAWAYSTSRTSSYSVGIGGGLGQPQDNNDPSEVDPSSNTTLVGISTTEKYPVVSLRRYGLLERAFNWLSNKVAIASGDKTVRATALTAQATMPEATVTGQRSVSVNAQPMLATARIVKPANFAAPDFAFTALPFTADAKFSGYNKTIKAEPMTAHAELVDNFDMVYAGGEQIVLTLHHVDATLYLLEEA